VRTLAGQTVTVSFWIKSDATRAIKFVWQQNFGSGGSTTVTSSEISIGNATTSWTRLTATFAIDSISGKTIGAGNYLAAIILLPGATQTTDIWGVQLEIGSTATAFQTATGTIQGELAACQRYYEKSGVFTGTPGAAASLGEMWFPNATIANNETWQSPRFAVTKRVAPSVTTYSYNGTSSRAANDSGTDYGADSANVWRANETGFVIKNNSGSSMTVTSGRWVYCNWAASAEL
jgi:hypothetical protein